MLPVNAQHMACTVCTAEHSVSHRSCKAGEFVFFLLHDVVLLSSCVCNHNNSLLCPLASNLHAALKSQSLQKTQDAAKTCTYLFMTFIHVQSGEDQNKGGSTFLPQEL